MPIRYHKSFAAGRNVRVQKRMKRIKLVRSQELAARNEKDEGHLGRMERRSKRF